MSTTAPGKRVFHAMDAGRGIAALVVVIFHLPVSLRGSAFGNGDLAVDFFFALSGFVLAHVYSDQLATGRMSARKFMVARLVRLYPLYLLSLLTLLIALMCLRVFSQPISWTGLALAGKVPFALFMLPSPTLDPHGYLYPFNVAAWSILLEIAVNLLFAIFWRPLQSARIRWTLIVVSGVLLAAQLILQHGTLGGASWNSLFAGVLRVCFSFFVGMQIYEWHKSKGRHTSGLHPAWSIVSLAILFAVLYAPEATWLKLAAIFVIFPALLAVLSATNLPPGRSSHWLQELGVISYAVYMMHGPVLFLWSLARGSAEGVGLPFAGSVAVLIVAVLLTSWAADRLFDRPVRGYMQRRVARYL